VSRIISSVSLSALSWTVCSVFPRQSPVWLPAFSCTVHSLQNVPSMMTSRALYITWLNFSGDNFSHLCRYLPRPISTRFNMRSHFHDTRLTIQAFLFASLPITARMSHRMLREADLCMSFVHITSDSLPDRHILFPTPSNVSPIPTQSAPSTLAHYSGPTTFGDQLSQPDMARIHRDRACGYGEWHTGTMSACPESRGPRENSDRGRVSTRLRTEVGFVLVPHRDRNGTRTGLYRGMGR
jgi:hypothetical protein